MKHLTLFLSLTWLCATSETKGQCTIPPPTGTECTKITLDQVRIFQNNLMELLTLATDDKRAYGDTGRYAAAAVNFYTHAKSAYDSISRFNSWMVTGGDGNPAVTSYAEAGHLMDEIRYIIRDLTHANWWAQISAIYHNSRYASCGREKSLQLLAESLNILTYSSRCYIGPYKDVPSCRVTDFKKR